MLIVSVIIASIAESRIIHHIKPRLKKYTSNNDIHSAIKCMEKSKDSHEDIPLKKVAIVFLINFLSVLFFKA